MQPASARPLFVPARSVVLLVFMPPRGQARDWLMQRTTQLHDQLGGSFRVLRVDETIYPEVVQSFDITHLPTLVLVRQGVELWRHEGLPNAATLQVLKRLLA